MLKDTLTSSIVIFSLSLTANAAQSDDTLRATSLDRLCQAREQLDQTELDTEYLEAELERLWRELDQGELSSADMENLCVSRRFEAVSAEETSAHIEGLRRSQLHLTIHADWSWHAHRSARNVDGQIDDYSFNRNEWTILMTVRWAFHR
jgi:hypothetical protein